MIVAKRECAIKIAKIMIENTYPVLQQFFSCYFHQDWLEEFGSTNVAIESFVVSEDPDSVIVARGELLAIIETYSCDDDLSILLSELGSYYDARVDYSDNIEWLKKISNRLS